MWAGNTQRSSRIPREQSLIPHQMTFQTEEFAPLQLALYDIEFFFKLTESAVGRSKLSKVMYNEVIQLAEEKELDMGGTDVHKGAEPADMLFDVLKANRSNGNKVRNFVTEQITAADFNFEWLWSMKCSMALFVNEMEGYAAGLEYVRAVFIGKQTCLWHSDVFTH